MLKLTFYGPGISGIANLKDSALDSLMLVVLEHAEGLCEWRLDRAKVAQQDRAAMPNMRAKMKVASVTTTSYSDTVAMQAVYGGSTNAEDNTYAKATPGGSLSLQIDNPDVRGTIKADDVFYVDFTKVEP